MSPDLIAQRIDSALDDLRILARDLDAVAGLAVVTDALFDLRVEIEMDLIRGEVPA